MRVLVLYNDPDPALRAAEKAPLLPESDTRITPEQSRSNVTEFVDLSNQGMATEVAAICESLEKSGYKADSLNLKNDLDLLIETLRRREMDVIFNLVESFHNESEPEMFVAGLYDLFRVPYTGAGPKALGNCLDKISTKRLLNTYNIRVPDYFVVEPEGNTIPDRLSYPLIIKPVHEDASAGIENDSVVYSKSELLRRIEYIHSIFKQGALIEEYVEGREFNVTVFGNNPPVTLPVSEIDFSGMPDHLHNIVSYQAKWVPEHEAYIHTVPVCPADIPEHLAQELRKTALSAVRIMGTRDYSRVDMRVNGDDDVYVLEVNPNPDISRDAGMMRAAGAIGWSHAETLKRIVELALERS
jgi:D-alanine-D-alanine ligase